ncbi:MULTISPECIES: hypothetical protein [unclassified Vibrio]|uniref:hypothetical protein n=1 Tax=unclassified Vibrio TaxID=2614977 RepID=UPI002F405440
MESNLPRHPLTITLVGETVEGTEQMKTTFWWQKPQLDVANVQLNTQKSYY